MTQPFTLADCLWFLFSNAMSMFWVRSLRLAWLGLHGIARGDFLNSIRQTQRQTRGLITAAKKIVWGRGRVEAAQEEGNPQCSWDILKHFETSWNTVLNILWQVLVWMHWLILIHSPWTDGISYTRLPLPGSLQRKLLPCVPIPWISGTVVHGACWSCGILSSSILKKPTEFLCFVISPLRR